MSVRELKLTTAPQCRGVWLDRGELDKILDRAQAEADALTAQAAPPAPYDAPHGQYQAEPRYDDRRDDRHGERRDDRRDDRHGARYDSRYSERRDGYDPRYGSRKKKSPFDFLGELFE